MVNDLACRSNDRTIILLFLFLQKWPERGNRMLNALKNTGIDASTTKRNMTLTSNKIEREKVISTFPSIQELHHSRRNNASSGTTRKTPPSCSQKYGRCSRVGRHTAELSNHSSTYSANPSRQENRVEGSSSSIQENRETYRRTERNGNQNGTVQKAVQSSQKL